MSCKFASSLWKYFLLFTSVLINYEMPSLFARTLYWIFLYLFTVLFQTCFSHCEGNHWCSSSGVTVLFCWLCILIYACNYIHYMHLGVTVCLMLVSYLHNNVMFHKLFQFVRVGSVYEKTWWYYWVWWIFIMFKVCNFSWFSLLPRDSHSCVCSFCVSFSWSICFLISTSNAVSVLAC
jgi:hypothetical protein